MNVIRILVSNRLKAQPCWKPLLNSLLDASKYEVEAFDSADFDIVLRMPESRDIHYLLLKADDLSDRFCSLNSWIQSSGSSRAIVVLVGSGDVGGDLQALQDIQLHLLAQGVMVTVLPMMKMEQLKEHFDQMQNAALSFRPLCNSSAHQNSEAVISQASTSDQPLAKHDIHQIREICGSLEGLEKATRFESGRQRLRNTLGNDKAQSLFTFWDDEWLAL